MRTEIRFRDLVLGYLLQEKRGLSVAVLCMIGYTVTQLLVPWPFKLIFDHVLLDKPLSDSLSWLSGIMAGGKTAALIWISLSIVLIAVLRGFFSYAQIYNTSRIGYRLVYALRSELFVHMQRLSLAFHNRVRAGELLAKITSDTTTLKDVFTEHTLTFSADSLTLVGMFAIMLALNWKLALVVLATFPVLLAALLYLYGKIKTSAQSQRKKEGDIASRISETLSSVAMIQAFGRERYEEERFETESSQTLQESIRTARMEAATTRTVEIISAAGTGAVVLVGALQVLKGTMLPGELLVFTGYLTNMYKPVKNLARFANRVSKAMVSAERIVELLRVEPEIKDVPHAVEAVNVKGAIVFDKVSFDYGDGKPVLRDVSFTVPPGKRVALVGPSGSGKSTIVSLMLRLYEVKDGAISVDGLDIKDYQIESLRREIGIVLQESLLFGSSIAENIAYGKLDATMEEIVAAAKAANAHDFIMALEDGYDTVVGERGATLSGGQRRRIAIARALVRNAPIVILDEPMTGLDVKSEAAVRDALEHLMAGKTSLLITHDMQAVASADLVLLLEDGRIAERGTHAELMGRSRKYRQLYELKLGRQESDEAATQDRQSKIA